MPRGKYDRKRYYRECPDCGLEVGRGRQKHGLGRHVCDYGKVIGALRDRCERAEEFLENSRMASAEWKARAEKAEKNTPRHAMARILELEVVLAEIGDSIEIRAEVLKWKARKVLHGY